MNTYFMSAAFHNTYKRERDDVVRSIGDVQVIIKRKRAELAKANEYLKELEAELERDF
jgi:hypothetical protein